MHSLRLQIAEDTVVRVPGGVDVATKGKLPPSVTGVSGTLLKGIFQGDYDVSAGISFHACSDAGSARGRRCGPRSAPGSSTLYPKR